MATSTTTKQGDPIGSALFTLTETSTTATAVNMDSGSSSGGAGIHLVEIDNTGNSVASYLNLYDAGSATVGTDDESFVFMAPASTRITYACPEGASYVTGLTGAIVSTPGSATGPASTVTAYILVST